LESERLSYFNAIATAEGAIMEACQLSPMNFYKNHSVVIGYGRCGSILADRLRGMYSLVTVCEKKEELRVKAEVLGFQGLDTDSLDQVLSKAQFVFNTAPALVLQDKLLELLPPRAVIVDVSSAPGGIDFKAVDRLGIMSNLV